MSDEESFIILDETPSLMEPFSFLEVTESMASVNTSAPSIANAPGLRTNPSISNNANMSPTSAMRSVWSTEPLKPAQTPSNTVSENKDNSGATSSISIGSGWSTESPNSQKVPTAAESNIVIKDNNDNNSLTNAIESAMLGSLQAPIAPISFAKENDTGNSEAISSGTNIPQTPKTPPNTGSLCMSLETDNKRLSSLSASPNLAESFLLGNIDSATMKSNILRHFPSLYIGTDDQPDGPIVNTETEEFKEKTENSNADLEQQYSMINAWQSNVEALQDAHYMEVKKCHNTIEELNNQNSELQRKLEELHQIAESQRMSQESSMDEMALQSNVAGTSGDGDVQDVNRPQTIAESESIKNTRDEYENQIKVLQYELSKAIGEKIEFEDMKRHYINEIDCLKVNLVATEELYIENVAETNVLKSKNTYLAQQVTDNEKHLVEMQTEIEFLKTQLDVYKKDFEIEQTTRKQLLLEREHLLLDLEVLQRRNQALLEDAERSAEAAGGQFTGTPGERPTRYSCPVCSTVYADVNELQRHVHECLDQYS